MTQNPLQPLFDAVVAHALAPDTQRSFTLVCRYRQNLTPEGNRCFIGVLIPDEHYNPDFDTHDLDFTNPRIWSLLSPSLPSPPETHHVQFLTDLQGIHDHSPSTKSWPHRLASLAQEYNLEMNT